MDSVSTAIILLAGNAPRYQDETGAIPRGLLEVDGDVLLQYAVDRLLATGFTKVHIVTGQQSRFLQKLAKIPGVEIQFDALFADFGSMFALRRAAPSITSFPFVLIESGILFESRLALLAKTMEHPNGVIVSENPRQRSEILAAGINQRLLSLMNREASGATHLHSESVFASLGVYKISRRMYLEMLAYSVERAYTDPFLDYVECIDGIASHIDIRLLPAPDILWAQIRSQAEMAYALNNLYPRILQQEQSLRP